MTPSLRNESFGALVRRERQAKEIGLREMSKMIGVSPTYLSKVERDEFRPPAEAKVKAIAMILAYDSDELLALAGRVASDIPPIIRENPREMATLLRESKNLGAEDVAWLADVARNLNLERNPQEMASLFLKAMNLGADDIAWLADVARNLKRK